MRGSTPHPQGDGSLAAKRGEELRRQIQRYEDLRDGRVDIIGDRGTARSPDGLDRGTDRRRPDSEGTGRAARPPEQRSSAGRPPFTRAWGSSAFRRSSTRSAWGSGRRSATRFRPESRSARAGQSGAGTKRAPNRVQLRAGATRRRGSAGTNAATAGPVRRVVVQAVAGSSPVSHPFNVRRFGAHFAVREQLYSVVIQNGETRYAGLLSAMGHRGARSPRATK